MAAIDSIFKIIKEQGKGASESGEVVQLRIATPAEGGGVRRLVGRAWRREATGGAGAIVSQEGGTTRYLVRLPAAVLGVEALNADQVLCFDLAIQHSDRTGRRGTLEWIGGHAHAWNPGGKLFLSPPE